MSFEEEGTKLAELPFSKMVRELFQENTGEQDTPPLSILNSAAKSLNEDELLLRKERTLHGSLFPSQQQQKVRKARALFCFINCTPGEG
jgi:hypothetical protein